MTKEQKKEFLQYLENLKLIQADDYFREGFDMAISALTADVRPNIHATWEKIWRTDCECSEYVCSKCGCGEDYQTDFCPNCGADMRGE